MENQFNYDRCIITDTVLAVGNTDAEMRIKGNITYKNLAGYLILVHDADGNIFSKKIKVAVRDEASGEAILPSQPFDCIRPSFAERPADRVVRTDRKGHGTDFVFRIESNSHATALTFTAVCYFTLNK